MHMPGPLPMLLIVILVLVLFGRGKIAGMMGEFGKGITAFKKGVKEGGEEIEKQTTEAAKDVTPENRDKL